VTIAFIAFVMGHDPRKRVMAISYAHDLSRKHAADFRTIIDTPWFRELFPSFALRVSRDMEIITTQRGHRIAGSIGGADFWEKKFVEKCRRDRINIDALIELGWKPIVIWECETRNFPDLCDRLKCELPV
jgi:hypothetical protein